MGLNRLRKENEIRIEVVGDRDKDPGEGVGGRTGARGRSQQGTGAGCAKKLLQALDEEIQRGQMGGKGGERSAGAGKVCWLLGWGWEMQTGCAGQVAAGCCEYSLFKSGCLSLDNSWSQFDPT